MKNKIIKIALVLSAFMLTIACNEDDADGDSVSNPSSPSLTVTLDFANSQTLIEQEVEYGFTVSLSTPQLVDVVVYLSQTGGTATEGDDFTFPHSLRIPAGSTSLSSVIAIHADELIEDTETATIQITSGAEANVSSINGQTVSFSIQNLVEGDLAIGMDWAATGFQFPDGSAFSPYELADLRLLLSLGPNNTDVIGGSDGGSAELYTLDGTFPDGEYYIVADFYAAYDEVFDIDVTLTFDQVGTINGQTHSFDAALNSANTCAASFFILAKVTKTGESYAIEEIGEWSGDSPRSDLADYVGTWSGPGSWSEIFGYTTEIVTTLDANGDLWMTGIGKQWFEGWWGEVIITEEPLLVSVDLCSDNFVIEDQDYVTSEWNGSPQPPYAMSATGTISMVGGVPTIVINPIWDQSGSIYDGTNFGGPLFLETITLAP